MFTNLVGYRTYLAAGLMATFGVLASVDWNTIFNNPSGLVAIFASILMAVLRSITTTPPGKVELPKPPEAIPISKTYDGK